MHGMWPCIKFLPWPPELEDKYEYMYFKFTIQCQSVHKTQDSKVFFYQFDYYLNVLLVRITLVVNKWSGMTSTSDR